MRTVRPAGDRTASEWRCIELRVNAKSQEIRDLKESINRAVLYLAIAAGAVIFDLIRKGTGSLIGALVLEHGTPALSAALRHLRPARMNDCVRQWRSYEQCRNASE